MTADFSTLQDEQKRQLASSLLEFVRKKSTRELVALSAYDGSDKPSPIIEQGDKNEKHRMH